MISPNYYELLELDPDASKEQIEKAIKGKGTLWTKGRADKRHEYENNRKQLGNIRKVMLDQTSSERQRMREELRNRQEEDLQRLRNRLHIMGGDGGILREDLEQIVRTSDLASLTLTMHKLEQEAHALGIEVRDEAPTSPTQVQPLDRGREGRIQESLRVLGKQTLYNFLDLPREADSTALMDKARTLQHEARESINKDAVVNAQLELAGMCLTLFADSSQRASYDESLRLKNLLPIIEAARFFAGAQGDISAVELNKLAGMGSDKYDLLRGEVEDAVRRESDNRWNIHVTKECPRCGKINPYHLIYCSEEKCIEPLFDLPGNDCSACGKATPALGHFCINCGIKTAIEI